MTRYGVFDGMRKFFEAHSASEEGNVYQEGEAAYDDADAPTTGPTTEVFQWDQMHNFPQLGMERSEGLKQVEAAANQMHADNCTVEVKHGAMIIHAPAGRPIRIGPKQYTRMTVYGLPDGLYEAMNQAVQAGHGRTATDGAFHGMQSYFENNLAAADAPRTPDSIQHSEASREKPHRKNRTSPRANLPGVPEGLDDWLLEDAEDDGLPPIQPNRNKGINAPQKQKPPPKTPEEGQATKAEQRIKEHLSELRTDYGAMNDLFLRINNKTTTIDLDKPHSRFVVMDSQGVHHIDVPPSFLQALLVLPEEEMRTQLERKRAYFRVIRETAEAMQSELERELGNIGSSGSGSGFDDGMGTAPDATAPSAAFDPAAMPDPTGPQPAPSAMDQEVLDARAYAIQNTAPDDNMEDDLNPVPPNRLDIHRAGTAFQPAFRGSGMPKRSTFMDGSGTGSGMPSGLSAVAKKLVAVCATPEELSALFEALGLSAPPPLASQMQAALLVRKKLQALKDAYGVDAIKALVDEL